MKFIIALLVVVALYFALVGCTVPTPSAGSETTYRIHATGHAIQDDAYKMTRFYDAPPGIWLDDHKAPWRYDENGWTKL